MFRRILYVNRVSLGRIHSTSHGYIFTTILDAHRYLKSVVFSLSRRKENCSCQNLVTLISSRQCCSSWIKLLVLHCNLVTSSVDCHFLSEFGRKRTPYDQLAYFDKVQTYFQYTRCISCTDISTNQPDTILLLVCCIRLLAIRGIISKKRYKLV